MSDPKLLNIYLFGSQVYGTNDEQSDVDYIFVVDHQQEKEVQTFRGMTNITSYPYDYFQTLVDKHSVKALECIFTPVPFKIETVPFEFKLDPEKLRRSFSEKASNSWVKAKKKIDIHQEYRLGMKSLFHSMRILQFGIQIARFGEIIDYRFDSDLQVIKNQGFKTWSEYKGYWQQRYNDLKTTFRKVCPLERDK